MALSDGVSGGEIAPGQDLDRRQGINAAGRVLDAARLALERGDEAGAEDLLNAIKPPDGTIEAGMAVLRSMIRDIRVARRQLDDGLPAGALLDGSAPTPRSGGSGGSGADPSGAVDEVDEALVAWRFVEPPAPAAAAAPTPSPIPGPAPSALAPAPAPAEAARPTPLLFEAASEAPAAAPRVRWAVALVVVAAAAAALAYLQLR